MVHPLLAQLPSSWADVLIPRVSAEACAQLFARIETERGEGTVYPPSELVFSAFHATPFDDVRAAIVGQDPYHGPGQAHGLAFSVAPGVKPPPSLANLYKELVADVGCPSPQSGSLLRWATQGVLLMNTVLTVREATPNAHRNAGWAAITDAAIDALSARTVPVVFVLWGDSARKKKVRIDLTRHRVVEGVHPSPLSAHRGFFGSRPFTAVNTELRALGRPEIDWSRAGMP